MRAGPILVLHYNELWLKGCNRPFFLGKLREHVQRMLQDLPVRLGPHADRRMIVEADSQEDAERAADRLRMVPGIAYIGRGVCTDSDLDSIVTTGAAIMANQPLDSFRVRARRSRKTLPYSSGDIERALGARILEEARAAGHPARVDLKNAQTTCHVEASLDEAYLYSAKIPGMGGLPTGTAGRLMCLLSGGIDSAVAAHKIMRRGVRVSFIHFHGAPARPGEESQPIAREIVKKLTPYQGLSRLYLVPFDAIQREIVAGAPDEFRLLLYRRMMLRIAERIGRGNRCHGSITGDSIAQVASQTLLNLEAVDAVARQPIFRPLCGDDKLEITKIAEQIGTYSISIEPFTDCCPAYLPRSPRIFATVAELDAAEERLDIQRLSELAVRNICRETYEYTRGQVRLKSSKDYVRGKETEPEHAVAG